MQTVTPYLNTFDGIRKLLRAQDVAFILNISRSYAYLLMQTGQLPTVRIGRSLRARIEDVETFIQANCNSAWDGKK